MAKSKRAADHYFEALRSYESMSLSKLPNEIEGSGFVRDTLLGSIRDARVFDVPHDLFVELVELTEDIAIHEWGIPLDLHPREAQEALIPYLPPFPGPLPFPNMFIAVTPAVGIMGSAAYYRSHEDWMIQDPYIDQTLGHILGYMISEAGIVSEVCTVPAGPQTPHQRVAVTTFNGQFVSHLLKDAGERDRMKQAHGWNGIVTLVPWVVSEIVKLINSYVSTVTERGFRTHRRRFGAKMRKLRKAPPPPYYPVMIKQSDAIQGARYNLEDAKRLAKQRQYTHRFDRRGSWVLNKKRGPLPLNREVRADLVDKGYTIWESKNPDDDEILDLMTLRGVPDVRRDEWFAARRHWRRATIVGSEDLPYIPSTHVVPVD